MVLNTVAKKVVDELLSAVSEMKDRAVKFRPTLEQLETTLKSIEPVVNEIEEFNRRLGRPGEETENIINDMKSGKELVLQCSNDFQWWNCFCMKAHYQKELEALNKSICSFFQLDGNVQLNRNVLQLLVEFQEFRVEPPRVPRNDRIELSGVCTAPAPPEFTVGFGVPLNELKLKLLQEEGSVSVLTVTGSGGSGKTTLARMICWDERVKGKFKENIFYITFGKKPKLNTIVQKLLRHNNDPVPEFESDIEAVDHLKQLLIKIGKKGPLLLVLEDVWRESESLVDKFRFPIPNYKIFVTSRFPFTRSDFPTYVLKPLDEADATKLLCHSASLNQSSSDVSDVVKEIVKGCSYSPLALSVTGKSLSHKKLVVWRNRAKALSTEHSSTPDYYYKCVLTCLQKSLDVLDPKAIECFKDLSLFPEDQIIPVAALVDIWAELHCEDDADALENIYQLVNLNMADIIVTRKVASDITDYSYHYVTQHGLLRELAIRQTSQEPEDKRNRLIMNVNGNNIPTWLNAKTDDHIAARILSISTDEMFASKWCNLQPTEVEAMVLNLQGMKCSLPIFMEKMNNLKVLIIANYNFYPTELENFELLNHLSNLKRLRLEKVSIPLFSNTIVQLNNLQKCSFFICNVNEASSSCSAQLSYVLPNLVEMNFGHCTMQKLPDSFLSNSMLLNKLRITHCHKLSALPEAIGMLVNLESLRLSSCTDLSMLPDSVTSLRSLKFLDISNCISLLKLPEDISELGKLKKLNIKGCSRLSQLPVSIQDLEDLKDVVCDKEGAHDLWEPFRDIRCDVRLQVISQADLSSDFLYNLRP